MDRRLGRSREQLSSINVQLKRKTHNNIIIVTGMRHKTHIWVTRPMLRHYGIIYYEEIFVRIFEIKIVRVKYITISVRPN